LPAACATAWACHRCRRVPRWWPVTAQSGRPNGACNGAASGRHRARGDILVVLPDEDLVVTDVSVVHPAADSFVHRAAHSRCGSILAGRLQVLQVRWRWTGGSFTLLSMESFGRLGRPAMQLLQTVAAASSATAGSDVTTSFVTGALRSLGQRE
jgi:hypothetical protein